MKIFEEMSLCMVLVDWVDAKKRLVHNELKVMTMIMVAYSLKQEGAWNYKNKCLLQVLARENYYFAWC